MRTATEIATEIALLKALRPKGAWALKTMKLIAIAIEELEYGFDDTAEEWNELSQSERDVVMTTRAWKRAESNDRPSEGWTGLVEPTGTVVPPPHPPQQNPYQNGV